MPQRSLSQGWVALRNIAASLPISGVARNFGLSDFVKRPRRAAGLRSTMLSSMAALRITRKVQMTSRNMLRDNFLL